MQRQQRQGLSLMELMIALIIVAIVAGMAYPTYQKMVARAKQTEAKTILKAIYMGQDLYKTSNQVYADKLEKLDMQIPGDTRYSYSVTVNANKTAFTARALANIDSDPAMDEWTINQDNTLANRVNDALE